MAMFAECRSDGIYLLQEGVKGDMACAEFHDDACCMAREVA